MSHESVSNRPVCHLFSSEIQPTLRKEETKDGVPTGYGLIKGGHLVIRHFHAPAPICRKRLPKSK